MTHAALTDPALFFFLVFMTLLLVMFLGAVVVTPLEPATGSSEESALEPFGLPPPVPVPVPALPARRPQAPASPAGRARPQGGASYAARHTPAAAPVIFAPQAPSAPRRGSKLTSILGITGLVVAVIGGWLFLGTSSAAVACARQGVAICSEGFVVLTGAELLGGAMVVAGIALGFTALWLALR